MNNGLLGSKISCDISKVVYVCVSEQAFVDGFLLSNRANKKKFEFIF